MATRKGGTRSTARKAYIAKRSRFRQSPKLRKTEANLARTRASLRKLRAQSKGAQGPLTETAAITAGGAAAGFAQGMYPDGIFGIDPALIAGGALVVAGIYLAGNGQGTTGKVSTYVGSGMLAAWAADFTSDMLDQEGT
jgi:hypothetical protein